MAIHYSNEWQYVDYIVKMLFKAEDERKLKTIHNLVERNNEAIKGKFDCFYFHGITFIGENGASRHSKKPALHESLWNDAEDFLASQEEIEKDRQKIKQVLYHLLQGARTLQHIRDAIPESLRDYLPDNVKELDRMDEPAFTIKHDRMKKRAFDRALPKIDYYAATRLIYS